MPYMSARAGSTSARADVHVGGADDAKCTGSGEWWDGIHDEAPLLVLEQREQDDRGEWRCHEFACSPVDDRAEARKRQEREQEPRERRRKVVMRALDAPFRRVPMRDVEDERAELGPNHLAHSVAQ